MLSDRDSPNPDPASGVESTASPRERRGSETPPTPPGHRLRTGVSIAVEAGAASPAAEQFRRLRSIIALGGASSRAVVVVTSPTSGDGKSMVALNLALACSMKLGTRTLLIDADLRKPGPTRWTVPPLSVGLADVLSAGLPLGQAWVTLPDSTLAVLGAGSPLTDPTIHFGGQQMREMIGELRRTFDQIVIDTPPLMPFQDAILLGAVADAILLVVRSEHTPRSLFEEALTALEGLPLIGTVLNDVRPNLVDGSTLADSRYGDYYRSRAQEGD